MSSNNNDSAIYEIAIQKIKEGQEATYPEARAAFLAELKKSDGIEKDWTFRSFFTMPTPDDTEVLVGITRWQSMDAFKAASTALIPTEVAGALFSRVDMKAFVQVKPADGQPFALEDHISGPEQVLEVAVRRPREGVSESDFLAARKTFFDAIAEMPGYLFDKEFIDEASGARAVLIGWRSTEDLERGLAALQARPEMGAFFAVIDVQAYQATRLA